MRTAPRTRISSFLAYGNIIRIKLDFGWFWCFSGFGRVVMVFDLNLAEASNLLL
jgi:hypothetical protein